MELKRRGSNRDSGFTSAFSGKKPKIRFVKSSGAVELAVDGANGMGAQGAYEYVITLGPNDVQAILSFIGSQRAAFEDGPFRESLVKASHGLLRLLIGSCGMPLLLPPSPEDLKLQELRQRLAAAKGGG